MIMQIVTDSGTDYPLASGNKLDSNVHIVPLSVVMGDITYQDGSESVRNNFFNVLESSNDLPTTSQPSAGDFAKLYRDLAAKDPDILSIHISSGLSGTINSATAATKMVPEANITIVDTKTLSVGAGWQVAAAAKAIRAGWPREKILALLKKISDDCHSFYTLNELKYLIHGGRISHMKGLVASILQIKPIIGVDHESGKYVQNGQARSFQGALEGVVKLISKIYGAGSKIRVQVAHTANPEGADKLHNLIDKEFDCKWLPIGPISFVLGAHTGPSMVGVCFTPQKTFESLP
jgi:DegV family protein with EDD domain